MKPDTSITVQNSQINLPDLSNNLNHILYHGMPSPTVAASPPEIKFSNARISFPNLLANEV